MEFEIWHIWMIACILFMILEVFIPSFIMASIGIGCLLAFFGAVFHGSFTLQLIFFTAGTLTGFVGVKPVMKRYMYRQKSVRTNFQGLVGRIGKVIEKIDPVTDSGCVAIDGDHWKAISLNDQPIEMGTKVKVIQLESIVVTVEPISNGNHVEEKIPVQENIATENNSLVVGVGAKKHLLHYTDIVCFYSTTKTTFLVTSNEKEFIHDDSLEKLNLIVPKNRFFRANRQFIISRDIISNFKSDENGKITIEIKPCNDLPASITVSRLKAHAFRAWMKKQE